MFRSRRQRVVALFVAVAVLIGVGVWAYFFRTYHLETVQPGVLYRDGCQQPHEFVNAVRKVKPKTVVSLIDDRERVDPEKPQFKKEEQILAERGIQLVRIPVRLGGWPSREDVDRFLKVAQDPANQPVLVHCAQGVRRTGMMVAAYQEAVLGLSDEQAKERLLTFGHSERTVGDIKRFIEGYDPKTGAVPEGLASGRE
jgi:protein tyrosine/serine phosphatase